MSEGDLPPAKAGTGPRMQAMKATHGEGFCSVSWCQIEGELDSSKPVWHAVTAGQDGKLVLRQGDEKLSVIHKSGDHEKATHCMAVKLDGKCVATVDDQYVQLYCTPDLELQSKVCRFTLPGRSLSFGGKDGSLLAAAGDDGMIKIYNMREEKVIRTIKTETYIRSVAVDPEGEFIAASAADGTLGVWNVGDGAQQGKKHICPKVDTASTRRSQVAWSPDGAALLAVPGRDQDVVLLERLSWEPAVYLTGSHKGDVNTLTFSPNGVYIATGGMDKQVVVWLADKGVAVAKTTLEEVPSSLSWHPRGDALLIAGEGGSVGMWEHAVPQGQELPSAWRTRDEVEREADAAAVAGASTAAGTTMDDGPEDSFAGGGAASGRINKRRGAAGAASGADLADLEDELDDDEDGGGGLGFARAKRQKMGAATGAGAAQGAGLLRPGAAATALMAAPAPRLPRAQAAVQPGATPEGAGGGRFLAYTSVGCVISRKVDSHRTCEVLFHDASRGRAKLPLLTDYFGFTMAALGEGGVLYGSPASPDAPPTLVYRPFDCWASNADWSVQLAADEAPVCVAAGRSFVAAATSRQLLRIFSPSGRQLATLSLPGAPTALSASGHYLMAVTQAASPCWETPDPGSQRLQFSVFDVSRQAVVHSGALPLSRGTGLAWLGFSDEGLPAAFDSAGVMRVRTPEWGGAWVPVFDTKRARAEGTKECFWPVSLTAKELTCVVTSEESPHPPIQPRPVLNVRRLQIPPAAAEGTQPDLEDESIRLGIRVAQMRSALAETDDAEELMRLNEELEAALLEADRLALRQFHAALNCRRESRALELVGQLNNARSIQGALQLANAKRQAALAERISAFLEERLAWEAEQAAQQAMEDEQTVGDEQAEGDLQAARAGARQQGHDEDQPEAGGEEDEEMEEQEQGEEEDRAKEGKDRREKGRVERRPLAVDHQRQNAAAAGAGGSEGASQGSGGVARGVSGKLASIFARSGSGGGSKGSAGGSGDAGKKQMGRQESLGVGSKPAVGGSNPFARVKKAKS